MTNATKCSANDGSKDKLPPGIYTNCRPYHLREIEILAPVLIYAEGKDSLPWGLKKQNEDLRQIENFAKGLTSNQKVIESIKSILIKYVFRVTVKENSLAYLIECPHPSDRGGRWQTFRDIALPVINLYARDKVSMPNKQNASDPPVRGALEANHEKWESVPSRADR